MVDVCETHTVVSSFLLYQGTLIGHVPGNDQCGVRLCGHGLCLDPKIGCQNFCSICVKFVLKSVHVSDLMMDGRVGY